MNGADGTLSVLREPAWTSLVQRLDALAASDAKTGATRDALLRPLRLLQIFASETSGALAQDVLAAERLRNLLYLASPWSALVEEADEILDGTRADEAAHEPGVIDLRVLTLVAIAAARVAPTKPLARMFLRTVHGLALSATPAEMLGHMEPYGHQSVSLREVVNLMVLPEAGRQTDSRLFLPRFALDPLSRGRWLCLRKLLGGLDAALDTVWATSAHQYAADADAVDALSNVNAAPGDEVTLTGRFPELKKKTWPKFLHVVFASESAPPVDAEIVRFDTDAITVRVPDGARPGWVGLADERLVVDANRGRRALRRMIAKLNQVSIAASPNAAAKKGLRARCFDGTVPSKWIPNLHGLPVPPRSAANRFAGDARDPGDGQTPPGTGTSSIFVPPALTVVLFRPIVAEAGERFALEPAQQVNGRIAATKGFNLKIVELPWIADPLAVLSHGLRSQDDPRITGWLERLSDTALKTPGLETALWLLIAPGAAPVCVYETAEAARAVAVATMPGMNTMGERILADFGKPVDRSPMPRLRVAGALLEHDELRIYGSRIETTERFAGAGAPIDSGFAAVAIDAAGRELYRQPIRVLTRSRPARFALLVPITPEVDAVVFREARHRDDLFTIRKTDAAPVVFRPPHLNEERRHPPELHDDVVHWRYTHPRGARSQAIVEVARDGIWTPFARLDACRDTQKLPLQRLQKIDRMRVVASDGWNVAEESLKGASINGRPPVVARRINARQWWADVAKGWTVSWHLPGKDARHHALLEVPDGMTGNVKLVATDPATGEEHSDVRSLTEKDWP
jgi:hypothetical protein